MLRFLLLTLLLASAGCAQPTASPTTTPAAAASPSPTTTASATALPATPTPTATSIPPAATPTQPPPTPTPLPPAYCSPLGGYALEELAGIVSQPFIAPAPGKDDGHHGTDFAHYAYGDRTTIAGAPVQAMLAGQVAAVILDSWPYGQVVILESKPEQAPDWSRAALGLPEGASLYHLYAHLEKVSPLAVGDAVGCGDDLGTVGNTGWSGNYHLHLELRIGPPAAVFESMSYYLTTTTEEMRANYERWRFGGQFIPLDPMRLIAAGND